MEELNRRQLLITAGAAGAAGGAAIVASARASDGGDGRPQLPETPEDYRFPLARTTPQIVRTGGSITTALPDNFPVLQDNEVSVG
jgi:hypothetical protein